MYKKQVFKSDTFANQKIGLYLHSFAGVVELVDTLDLGSSAARRGGSTPFTRTESSHNEGFFYGNDFLHLIHLIEAALLI